MKLVLGQDDDRLSRHERTQPLFDVIINDLPADQPDRFAQAMSEVGAPHVLFWHEEASAALKLLRSLRSTGDWPDHLRGVVLYRRAPFAGLHTRVRAGAALREHKLDDGTVHIFEPDVVNRLSDWVIDLILSFARSAADLEDGPAPFVELELKSPSYSRITLFLLDGLVRALPHREEVIYQPRAWSKVREHFARHGVDCPEAPTTGAFRKAAAALGKKHPDPCLPCGLCGRRGQLAHSPKQRRNGLVGDAATAVVSDAVRGVRAMLERAPEADLSNAIRQSLAGLALGELFDDLLPIVGGAFEASCGVAKLRSAPVQTGAELDQVVAGARSRPADAAKRLEKFLECAVSERAQVPL